MGRSSVAEADEAMLSCLDWACQLGREREQTAEVLAVAASCLLKHEAQEWARPEDCVRVKET